MDYEKFFGILPNVKNSVTQLIHQLMHLYKIYTLKHYNCSNMFRSQDHHQGAVFSLLKSHLLHDTSITQRM